MNLEPFENWGMDFTGPIDPPSGQKKYIIVWTNSLTKWAGEKKFKEETKHKVVEFLRENIFYKFGFQGELAIDQGTQFTSNMIEGIMN